MTSNIKYRHISLRSKTYYELENLSKAIVPGVELSKAKCIEKLINDKVSDSEDLEGLTCEKTDQKT